MIKVDYNQAPKFEEFKTGYYEAIVTEATAKKTSTGKNMIVFNYKVRDDVEQECKNKSINYDNFVINEDNEYFAGFFNQRSKAYGIPNGVAFDTYTEWAQSVVGNAVKLKIEAVQNGQYVNANVKSWLPTEHPMNGAAPSTDGLKDPFKENSGPIEVDDSELPF